MLYVGSKSHQSLTLNTLNSFESLHRLLPIAERTLQAKIENNRNLWVWTWTFKEQFDNTISKTTPIVWQPGRIMSLAVRAFDQISTTRHEFPFCEHTFHLIRKWLVISIPSMLLLYQWAQASLFEWDLGFTVGYYYGLFFPVTCIVHSSTMKAQRILIFMSSNGRVKVFCRTKS